MYGGTTRPFSSHRSPVSGQNWKFHTPVDQLENARSHRHSGYDAFRLGDEFRVGIVLVGNRLSVVTSPSAYPLPARLKTTLSICLRSNVIGTSPFVTMCFFQFASSVSGKSAPCNARRGSLRQIAERMTSALSMLSLATINSSGAEHFHLFPCPFGRSRRWYPAPGLSSLSSGRSPPARTSFSGSYPPPPPEKFRSLRCFTSIIGAFARKIRPLYGFRPLFRRVREPFGARPDSMAKNQAFQQGVRRQPVRAMDAVAGGFPHA